MAENPLQHLFQAFGKVSECVQTHLSQFILRPSQPSTLLNKNDHSSLYISQNSTTDSHLLQPAEILKKGKSSGPVTKEELGRATWTFLHTLAAQYPDKPTRQQKKDVKELAIQRRNYRAKLAWYQSPKILFSYMWLSSCFRQFLAVYVALVLSQIVGELGLPFFQRLPGRFLSSKVVSTPSVITDFSSSIVELVGELRFTWASWVFRSFNVFQAGSLITDLSSSVIELVGELGFA
ncbi:FAD-linked sulfhydryl oxidase ERV1 [Olea europaea subsp. europaea]|uniref:thiol oxidase n=1 Tax=Olea europaea subsp. europaea TaxID=158383 RepID=A0A8S0QNN4_OLEEU|nr:FAD-linked sulfhydryl oxidase ERV1 [Olea europaea subsp. europaea]